MIDKEGFGERLEKCMKMKGITNTEITKILDLNKNAIGNYKNGQIPNASILYELSNFLGISMEYLLAGKESEELSPEEQQLVDLYRLSSLIGQDLIIDNAKAMQKKFPKELESSASPIGLTGTND